jgi:hypothetical protein
LSPSILLRFECGEPTAWALGVFSKLAALGVVGKEGLAEEMFRPALVVFCVEDVDGYKCSAAKATTDSKGTRRFVGSSATRSAFVPTMWRIVSSGRLARSSCSQWDISVKEEGEVMS